jgi:hypothetical protein
VIARESFRSHPPCIRRIKEVDAAGNRCLDQFIGPGLANGADGLEEPSAVPECHGSEAEFRNQETCIAERRVFHGVFLSCDTANFLASGLKRQDNDLIVFKDPQVAAKFKHAFEARFASGKDFPINGR